MEDRVDDLTVFLELFPEKLSQVIQKLPNYEKIVEVIMDLGAVPEVRFSESFEKLPQVPETSQADIDHVIAGIGTFNTDNRAGIERTLHRISGMRNREGTIIGLTCRVGRAVEGTITVLQDIIEKNQNVLFLGPPGSGKTTKLREAARVLADTLKKRVVVVDTSNEIAGDGDIPHPGIGSARRMQVPSPDKQHATMIEAVENHMPQTIIVDEIGTEEEASASRTISQRGVQLIATAHGMNIENLLKNPTLSDLLGGVQSVILGDEEAKFRGTQKTVLERRTLPTFDVLIEIKELNVFHIYHDVKNAVDALLRGYPVEAEIRTMDAAGKVNIENEHSEDQPEQLHLGDAIDHEHVAIFPLGITVSQLNRVIETLNIEVEVVNSVHDATLILSTKSHTKSKAKLDHLTKGKEVPLHVLKQNSATDIMAFFKHYFHLEESMDEIEKECELEIQQICTRVFNEKKIIEAAPRPAFFRRIQHEYAASQNLNSLSTGEEPNRRVRVFPQHG